MEIKTRRLLLRPWRMEDAASVFRFANNPKIAENLRDVFPWPYQEKDAEEFLRGCVAADEKRALFRAIEVDGQAVGSIALTRGEDVYGRSAELGYWLAEEFWGQGIMPRAVEQLCREGFARWDIVRICAEPYRGNTASRRVLEKAGFTLEGVMRQGTIACTPCCGRQRFRSGCFLCGIARNAWRCLSPIFRRSGRMSIPGPCIGTA